MTRRMYFPLILLIGAVTLFSGLGGRGLNEPDEGRYAGIAAEMYRTGDLLIPRIYGAAHFEKPPLIYWLLDLSYHVFGVNEFAARLPAALAALGNILLVWWMGRRLYGHEGGVIAALVLLSSPLFFAMARIADLNMLHTFWITLALCCYLVWQQDARTTARWIFYAALGVSLFTKGPVGPIVVLLAIAGLRLARCRNRLRPIFYLPGLLITSVIGLWWYVVTAAKHPELWKFFVQKEFLGRYFSQAHNRSEPFWYYFWLLPVSVLPWIPAHATIIKERLKDLSENVADALLLSCVVLPLIFFSFSGSKLPTYILPLLPALALLAARQIIALRENPKFIKVQLFCMITVALGIPLTVAVYGNSKFHWSVFSIPLQYPILLLLVIGLVFFIMKARGVNWIAAATALLLASYIYIHFLIYSNEKAMGRHGSFRDAAEAIRAQSDARQPIVLYHSYLWGLSFYLDRPVFFPSNKFHQESIGDEEIYRERAYNNDTEILNRVHAGMNAVYVTCPKREDELRLASPIPLKEVYRRYKTVVLMPEI